jgi:hypothetical protein
MEDDERIEHCKICNSCFEQGAVSRVEYCSDCQDLTHFERQLLLVLRSIDSSLTDIGKAAVTYEQVQAWK